jgi:hypothetical protein
MGRTTYGRAGAFSGFCWKASSHAGLRSRVLDIATDARVD